MDITRIKNLKKISKLKADVTMLGRILIQAALKPLLHDHWN